MRRFFTLFCLALCITAAASAQSYTQHLQNEKQGKGNVTVTQSREIEELVNSANVSARQAQQTPTAAQHNTTTPQTKKQNTTAEQPQHKNVATTPQQHKGDSAHKSNKEKEKELPTTGTHHETQQPTQRHETQQPQHHEAQRPADSSASDAVEKEPVVDMRKKVMRRYYKTNGYRVQVFAGGNSRDDKIKAQNAGNAVKRAFPSQPIYVHFYSPRWICRMGNYRTYQEASAILSQVRKMGYKQACIVSGKITVAY